MFRQAIYALLVAALSSAAHGSSTDFDRCAGLESDSKRAACLLSSLGGGSPDEGQLRSLEQLCGVVPAAVLSLLDALDDREAPETEPAPELEARLLDLRGRALFDLERYDEASDAYRDALFLDDGTLRITWLSPTMEAAWVQSLDVGTGRLVRAARSLIQSGDREGSRELLARALSLGADGPLLHLWQESGGDTLAALDPSPTPLVADTWYKTVPDIELELHGGGSFALKRDREGKALVLGFWATWCEPCERELPKLQALFDAERERGLEVLAVNVGDSAADVASYLDALGLTFPCARSVPAAESFFDTRNLPLTAVIDTRNRVRGRWVGFRAGYAGEIEDLCRKILDEAAPPSREIGEVLLGTGLFRVAWMRGTAGTVDGLAVAPPGAEEDGLLVAAGRSLVLYGEDGTTRRTWDSPASIGRMQTTTADEEGGYTLIGFRRGSTRWISFGMPDGAPFQGEAPAPVFDAQLASAAAGGAPALFLATSAGLVRAPGPASAPEPIPGMSVGASAVKVLGEGAGLAVLGFDGTLTLLDGQRVAVEAGVPRGAWALVGGKASHGRGIGVAPGGVVASATGRFLDSERFQVALATESGQLLILDGGSGRPLVRVRWPGIRVLAAGDLAGDGRDELAVAGERRVAVLDFSISDR